MAHQRYKRRKRKTIGRFILNMLLLCFMSLAVVMGATVFFKIETIVVEGNNHYTQEEIIAATNIELGENLFALKKEEISKKITYILPYVQTLEIKLNLPTGIKLMVQEQAGMVELVTEDGIWYMGVQGKLLENSMTKTGTTEQEPIVEEAEILLHDEDSVSLETTANPADDITRQSLEATVEVVQQLVAEVNEVIPWDEEENYALEYDPNVQPIITVTGLIPLEPQAGELIQVAEGEQRQLESLLSLFQELEELSLFHNVSWIHIDKFNYLQFDFMSRFTVKIPFNCDFNYKLRALLAAVSDRESYETGIMDLTQEHYAVLFTPE